MKNLSQIPVNQIPDRELLLLVKSKAETERQVTLEVIDLLREVQSRKLHLKRGYSSLHEFCVKGLKYSDGAAFRRIKAMRLVEDIPEVVQSIQTGSLNLSTASQLQGAFETRAKEQKPMTREDKIDLVRLVQNQSRRNAERMIAKVCPETVKMPEKVRAINESQVKIELVIEGKLYQKIERLKSLTSHKNKSLIELFENLVDQELKRRDPGLKTSKSPITSPAKTNTEVSNSKVKQTRYISSKVKRLVWLRDQGQCTYVDLLTKRKCESKHKLTFEHIQPFSMGGTNTAENLRLLCASHNALTAIHIFGQEKMLQFRAYSVV